MTTMINSSEIRYRQLFESARDGILILSGLTGAIEDANPSFVELFGHSREELVGRQLSDIGPFQGVDKRAIALEELKARGRVIRDDLVLQTADGRRIDGEFVSVYDGSGDRPAIHCTIRDVTARKRAAHLYAVLSAVNDVILRTRELPQLYEKVCRVAVEAGRLRMAWVGLTDPETHLVRPVAYWGHEEGYLDKLSISIDPTTPLGKGPTGRAIRENAPRAFNDWEQEHDIYPWREAGFKRGYRSSAAFPLNVQGRVIGALTLYSGEVNFFTAEEMRLLETLGNDLAFAIESIERDEQRCRAEQSMRLLNAELERRIASRTAELTAANRELEAFSYSVSHDLRAPLRAIDGFSRIVADASDEIVDPTIKDYLRRIRTATARMSDLIDDLLSLSRIGRQELHLTEVDLSGLARSIAAELRDNDPARQVEFVIPDSLTAVADQALMRIVLENLLRNAWKFTSRRPAAQIEFGVVAESGGPAWFVRDNGVGFDARFVDKLFVPFQRLHGTSEFEGSGIGLAIVQRAIGRHGGSVRAEGAVDRGATFFFTLPSSVKGVSHAA